jgi:hypothetical protein
MAFASRSSDKRRFIYWLRLFKANELINARSGGLPSPGIINPPMSAHDTKWTSSITPVMLVSGPKAKSRAVGTRIAPNAFWSHDQPFARADMVDFVRSDGGGFLTGSMIAMLVLCAIFFVAGSFD